MQCTLFTIETQKNKSPYLDYIITTHIQIYH